MPGSQNRILTIDKGRFIVRRARLAFGPPAMFALQPGEARGSAQLVGLCLPSLGRVGEPTIGEGREAAWVWLWPKRSTSSMVISSPCEHQTLEKACPHETVLSRVGHHPDEITR
jgi:hypothetical protein